MDKIDEQQIFDATIDLALTYITQNQVAFSQLGDVIRHAEAGVRSIGQPAEPTPAELIPAAAIKRSVKPDHIICLECGTSHKMLKRHLSAAHGMTPAEYRARWGLPASYPMVAPNYAEKRREIAKASGLGTGSHARRKPKAEKA